VERWYYSALRQACIDVVGIQRVVEAGGKLTASRYYEKEKNHLRTNLYALKRDKTTIRWLDCYDIFKQIIDGCTRCDNSNRREWLYGGAIRGDNENLKAELWYDK